MADGITQVVSGETGVGEIVEPVVFAQYIQQLTEVKSRLVQSGVMGSNPLLNQMLMGGGLTFTIPSFRDLDDDADNVSGQQQSDMQAISESGGTPALPAALNDAIPQETRSDSEVAVRLNRNQSWSSSDLAGQLAGSDPMDSIAARVSDYWVRRLQNILVSTFNGVIQDNTANDNGDFTNDISSTAFTAGVTDFSAEAFLDAAVTMGDSQEDITTIMVHSIVYNRMQKNNLCLLYTSPSPRDRTRSRMPSSA